jgi:hypothetical protein
MPSDEVNHIKVVKFKSSPKVDKSQAKNKSARKDAETQRIRKEALCKALQNLCGFASLREFFLTKVQKLETFKS